MSTTLKVVNASSIPLINYRSLSCSLDQGPRAILEAWDLSTQDSKINPALPIFDGPLVSLEAERILKHWCRELATMAARGDGQGVVTGQSMDSIPSGKAYIWSDGFPLKSLLPFADVDGPGIHCIILPPSSVKRPAEAENIPSKKQNISKTALLPTSTSNETAITDVAIRQRIIDRCDNVLRRLGSFDSDIHDPARTYVVPLPTIYYSNPKWAQSLCCGTLADETTGFAYRGRSSLHLAVLPILKEIYNDSSCTTLGYFGTRGAGRTHITIAAAALLLAEQIPVVFLAFPEGVQPRTAVIRDAFVLALRTTDSLWQYTDYLFDLCCRNPDSHMGLIKFSNYLQSKNVKLLFVVLRLDNLSESDLRDFHGMTAGHAVFFTTDSNSSLRDKIEDRIAGGYSDRALYLNGGLEKDELKGWLSQYETECKTTLGAKELEMIETTTGNVPHLLSLLFRAVKTEGIFVESQLQLVVDVHIQFSHHIEGLRKRNPESLPQISKLLLAAMHHSCLEVPAQLTDQRFIYKDAVGRWRCNSLFAYEAAYHLCLSIQDCFNYFNVKQWTECIPFVAHNPSMLEYAIEYAITNVLRLGLVVTKQLSFDRLPLFPLPAGGKPSHITEDGIYVPVEFNHRYIDCVVVWFESSTVHVVPVQISNIDKASDHSDSENTFFSSDWRLWHDAVMKPHLKIQWDFIWILRRNGPKQNRRGHGGSPPRTVHTIAFNAVSKEVNQALKRMSQ